ncbi:MAG: alanyl-tRNA editing protein [Firmicutes bacterium]|nr:alanyl-tRNA editing protein [Bacillota bacterium]
MAERLYYEDPYLTEFEATVRSVVPAPGPEGVAVLAVTLDRTAFYPESGGQPWDLGDIGGLSVAAVIEEDGEVLHLVRAAGGEVAGAGDAEAPVPFRPGDAVTCRVDFERRFDHMQQHLGQHILSSAFEKTLDADTVGFHLGHEYVAIDLNAHSLDERDAARAEDLANRIVFENRRVAATWYSLDEALRLPLRKRPEREGPIRIIEVDGFDYSPCGGTHPRCTGEVGLINVIKWERVRSGVRLSFVCGNRALQEFRWKNALVNAISRSLSVAPNELDAAVSRQVQQVQALSKEVERLSASTMSYEAEAMLAKPDILGQPGIPLVVARSLSGRTFEEARVLAAKVAAAGNAIALLATPGPEGVRAVFSRSDDVDTDMGAVMKEVMAALGGKGGGTPKTAQGGVKPQAGPAQPEEIALRLIAMALDAVRRAQ